MSLDCIVPDVLWHAQQPLKFGPIAISTRMTVVRLRDGSLWIHSPISPSRELVESFRGIGDVRHVLAPNRSHHLFFLDFLNAFPQADGYVAAGLVTKRPDLARFARITNDHPWDAELQAFRIEGLPVLDETVWFHRGTGTLIITDLLFCFGESSGGLAALVSRALGVRGTLGMSRTMKWAVRNQRDLARSVEPLLSLPVERVIVAHDQIIAEQPQARLAQAFAWLR
jgi:hypothetical protein